MPADSYMYISKKFETNIYRILVCKKKELDIKKVFEQTQNMHELSENSTSWFSYRTTMAPILKNRHLMNVCSASMGSLLEIA